MNNQKNSLTDCNCCAEDDATSTLYNPPGLSALNYRIGTHGSFKKEMLKAISGNKELAKLTTRNDDDFAIASIDAWATVLDILSFYQERICNEGYLRTAIERLSVLYLARHIHYVPPPGVSAETHLAFSMNEAQGAPPSAIIPKGTKVQSIPKQDQLPQIFETEEEINAKVDWNKISPQSRFSFQPKAGDQIIYVDGTQTGLQPGDKILFVSADHVYDSNSDDWDFCSIADISIDKTNSYSIISLAAPIGQGSTFPTTPAPVDTQIVMKAIEYPYLNWARKTNSYNQKATENLAYKVSFAGTNELQIYKYLPTIVKAPDEATIDPEALKDKSLKVYAMKQKANLFGYNAPNIDVLIALSSPDSNVDSLKEPNSNPSEWKDFSISAIANAENSTIFLDAIYSKIVRDSLLVMINPGEKALFKIKTTAESSQSKFTLTSKTTKLKLSDDPDHPHLSNFDNHIRDTFIYAQSEQLQMAKITITTPLNNNQITLETLASDLFSGQKIFINGKRFRLEIPISAGEVLFTPSDPDQPPKYFRETSLIIAQQPMRVNGKIRYTVIDDGGLQGTIQDDADFTDQHQWKPKNLAIIPAQKDDEVLNEFHTINSINFLSATDSTQYGTLLTLNESIANYFDLQTVTINANVASANHGETKQEVLGNGNSSQIFQKFQLRQQPLTFTSANNPTGAQTTLEIRVNNIKWNEVASFYGASRNDKIYTVTIADDGAVTVCFGDGITGSRLPTGTGNVKATYRTGIGLSGLMDINQLSMLVTPQLGVNKVTNPLASSGAQDAETMDSARQNAPLTVLTLDRIVSVADFQNFTRAFAGIGKSRADVMWNGEQEIINITAALPDGKPIQSSDKVYDDLLKALKDYAHTNATINVTGFHLSPFTIDVAVAVNKDYEFEKVKQSVAASLFQAFSFNNMNFGQDVTSAQIINVIQQVEGVIYVQLMQLNNLDPFSNDRLFSPVPTMNNDGTIQPAELLVIDINNSTITQL
jgi:hypothetical protein